MKSECTLEQQDWLIRLLVLLIEDLKLDKAATNLRVLCRLAEREPAWRDAVQVVFDDVQRVVARKYGAGLEL
eukprot:m.76416 g.76416  ORF g.76416 m.76416 type:complete len:72 (+) comp8110_c0_seq2:567-782(+)